MREGLNKEEYEFLRKLFMKITNMRSSTEEQRNQVLDFVKNEFKKKKQKVDFIKKDIEENFYIYEFEFNNKKNYISFDKFGKLPINIVPFGVFSIETK